jgi:hypothetical protein
MLQVISAMPCGIVARITEFKFALLLIDMKTTGWLHISHAADNLMQLDIREF